MRLADEGAARLKHWVFAQTGAYRLILHYRPEEHYQPLLVESHRPAALTAAGLAEISDYLERGLIRLFGRTWRLADYRKKFANSRSAKRWWRLPLQRLAFDPKYLWELNRHQHLPLLALAGCQPECRRRLTEQIRTELLEWLEDNPPERGLNWRSNLEVALRAFSWVLTYLLLRPEPDSGWTRWLAVLSHHGRHLEKQLSYTKACIPNNHLLGELCALVVLGLFFGKPHWVDYYRELDAEVQRQFYPDGVNFEQSVNYHRFTLDLLLLTQNFLKSQGLLWSGLTQHRLDKAAQFVRWVRQPDGSFPNVGDNDNALAVHPEVRKVLIATPESAVEAGVPAFRAFPDGGFYIWRSGWGERDSYLLVKAGPNAGHGHADLGHFEYCHRGEPVFVDAGTYQYNRAPLERNYFRSTAAHNTLAVGGESQSQPLTNFRWSRHSRVRDVSYAAARTELTTVFEVAIAYPDGRSFHHRTIQTNERLSALILEDRCRGAATGVAYLHIHPQNRVRWAGRQLFIATPSGNDLRLTFISPGLMAVQLETMPYSETYGDLRFQQRIGIRFRCPAGEGFLRTVIVDEAGPPRR